MSSHVIRWGILGCGDVCEVKAGPGFQKASGSSLQAVMRRDRDKARDFAKRHGVPTWYVDAEALIHDQAVDAVYVAAPPGVHESLAVRVCAAGKPCYVEKPMARNAAECDRMNAAFDAVGQKLFVAYYRRAQPRFLKVREVVVRLGPIQRVGYTMLQTPRVCGSEGLPWRLRAEHSGGGLFFDVGSHALDLLDFLVGPLKEAVGEAANTGTPADVEDRVDMSFRIGQAPGEAHWNFRADRCEDHLEIQGEAGHVKCSVFGTEPVTWEIDGEADAWETPALEHVAQPLIQTVVDELTSRGICPSTGISAARTARIMDRVTENFYGTRGDRFWQDFATRRR